MKLVFMGTADFAVPSLEVLAPHVALVVSQPDRPAGRHLRLQPSPVKLKAEELGLPVETPEKSRAPEFVERLRALEADALIVAAYGQILSQLVLESARIGGINLHGSILPAYRGAAPIQRAIMDGCTTTGVTLMQMDRGMDTGDMIAVAETPIGPDETYGELAQRLSLVARNLIGEWINRLVNGDYPRAVQDDSLASHAAKIEKSDAELSIHRGARSEYNRFRATTPSPGAFFALPDGPLKVLEARLSDWDLEAGDTRCIGSALHVGMTDGNLELRTVQPAGRKAMTGADFFRGHRGPLFT